MRELQAQHTPRQPRILLIFPARKSARRDLEWSGAAFGIGFVLGPAIGGIAAELHITAPFWIAAVLSAANVLFGLFVLPESLEPKKRRPFWFRDINPFTAIIGASKHLASLSH